MLINIGANENLQFSSENFLLDFQHRKAKQKSFPSILNF